MRRAYQAIAGKLIEGDYIGPMRGEVNVCFNMIHYYKAFEEAARQILTESSFQQLRDRAYKIREEKYGKLLW